MSPQTRLFAIVLVVFFAGSKELPADEPAWPTAGLRVATFNCSLNRDRDGQLLQDLKGGRNRQAQKIARILRTVRPDIVLLNEFDYDAENESIRALIDEYLSPVTEWSPEDPVSYPHFFSAPVNTGIPSGFDLDHDKKTDGPGDSYGFGKFPGQYGMVILSRFPVDADNVKTFQKLLWKDMPAALLPPATAEGGAWYSEQELATFRLSSKSHWDIPVTVGGTTLHILASHPTPPAFDGPEDRNGRRNHDEIRLWAEYISAGPAEWLIDDNGKAGTLPAEALFVIVGDQNADPMDGASFEQAIDQLLKHPRVDSATIPISEGGVDAVETQKGANLSHKGNPAHDTADFNDRSVGNLRADYALPSSTLTTLATAVFWPVKDQPGHDLVDCSDHRLVWIDVVPRNK